MKQLLIVVTLMLLASCASKEYNYNDEPKSSTYVDDSAQIG